MPLKIKWEEVENVPENKFELGDIVDDHGQLFMIVYNNGKYSYVDLTNFSVETTYETFSDLCKTNNTDVILDAVLTVTKTK